MNPEWLHPTMANALEQGLSISWQNLVNEESPGVFSFDFLSERFCELFVEEIDCYEASPLPRRRPNTMNVSGQLNF